MDYDTDDPAEWARAVDTFSCPFCGRAKGRKCGRVEATYASPLPDLDKPHANRLQLLADVRAGGSGRGFQ